MNKFKGKIIFSLCFLLILFRFLIHERLLKYYEELHTQSLDWVADDIAETLVNWERESAEIKN